MRSSRSTLALAHATVASVALLAIGLFWSATVVGEWLGDADTVTRVKRSIAWGLIVLVPAMLATAASGRALGGPAPRGLVGRKYRRTQLTAGVGLIILVPAALLLARWATAGDFGSQFRVVQVVELAAGALNLVLLGRSFRDGLRLRAARLRAERARAIGHA